MQHSCLHARVSSKEAKSNFHKFDHLTWMKDLGSLPSLDYLGVGRQVPTPYLHFMPLRLNLARYWYMEINLVARLP